MSSKAVAAQPGSSLAGVVCFAAVEVVAGDGAGGCLPAGAGCDGGCGAVGELDVELQAQARGVTVAVLPAGFAVPAVAEHDADGVGAGLQLFGDVVGDVEDALGVVAGGGVEDVVTDAPAVEVEFVPAEAGDMEAGAADGTGEVELFAQEGGGDVGRGADPVAGPVAFVEEAHGEGGGFGVGAGAVVLVPDAELPVAGLVAGQGGAGVGDVDGAVGDYFAAVPLVGAAGLEVFSAAGDEDLVGRLGLAAAV